MKRRILSIALAILLVFSLGISAGAMEIIVQTQSGETVTLDVEKSDTIENCKAKIQDKKGYAPDRQTLFFGDQQLEDNRTLEDYHVGNGDALGLVVKDPSAEWLVNEGTNHVWYQIDTDTLTIGGMGEIGNTDAIQNKDAVMNIIIADCAVTGAGSNAFAGINEGAILTLPDGWQGDLPDDNGRWYGAVVELLTFPNAVRNVTFLQRYPWNGYVDITAEVVGFNAHTLSVFAYQKAEDVWQKITSPVVTDNVDLEDGAVRTVSLVWDASANLTDDELTDVYVEVAMDEIASAKSGEGKVDTRTSVALPEGETTVKDVTWSDTCWDSESRADVTIGWENTETSETGLLAAELTDTGVAQIDLPQINGTYRLTHSTGELTSLAVYTVTGFYAVIDGTADLNGMIEVDKSTAKAGDTLTVTIRPASNYMLAMLTVEDADGEEVEVTPDIDDFTKYTFEMPAKAVTVTATFEVAIKPVTFADVLDSVEGFPITDGSEIPAGAWVNGNGVYCARRTTDTYDKLYFLQDTGNFFSKDCSETVTVTDDGYRYDGDGVTILFRLTDGKLASITVTHTSPDEYDGTYAVPHSHKGSKQNGQAATEAAAGSKEYYTCDCGKAFEDPDCTKEIENLNAWKAEGGAGYIAPIQGEPEPEPEPEPAKPDGQDKNSLVWLWILLGVLALLIVIYVVLFFVWKKNGKLPDALAFLGFLAPSYQAINGALFKKKTEAPDEKKE